jgi:hypothetical protein
VTRPSRPSNTRGDGNIAIGEGAGANLTTGDANIDIGHPGKAGEEATIRIGSGAQNAAFLQDISGTAISRPAQPVLINASGQLGTARAATRRGGARGKVADRMSTASLAVTVERLQRQVKRLREQVKGG